MTGVLVGLLLGCGLFCIWWSTWPRTPRRRRESVVMDRLRDELAQAGYHTVSPQVLVASCLLLGGAALLLVLVLTTVLTVSLCFAAMAAWVPFATVRMRARARRAQLRDLWPDVVDNITSAVRAGMALPEALAQLAHRGPEELRPAFADFANDSARAGASPRPSTVSRTVSPTPSATGSSSRCASRARSAAPISGRCCGP